MDKEFLFATSHRKVKNHVVEIQITLIVWPWLSLAQKQPTINHIITVMIQSVSLTITVSCYMKELWLILILSISSSV